LPTSAPTWRRRSPFFSSFFFSFSFSFFLFSLMGSRELTFFFFFLFLLFSLFSLFSLQQIKKRKEKKRKESNRDLIWGDQEERCSPLGDSFFFILEFGEFLTLLV